MVPKPDPNLATVRPHWPRRSPRVELDAEVSLRRPGQQPYRVRVYDASPHGCRIECVERPSVGDRLWVKFERVDAIESKVCWVDGFVAGVEFARPIYPAVFEALISQLP